MSILHTSKNLPSSTLVLASSNTSKLIEIQSIIQNHKLSNVSLKSLADFTTSEPDEPFDTFVENAVHKAKNYAQQTKTTCLAEDSGLCINALKGFPGVRSKDFIQENSGIDNAILILEQKLKGFPKEVSWTACIRSAVAIYNPETHITVFEEASDWGHLTFPPRGALGFGFDPIFIPQGQCLTNAELGAERKNTISNRTVVIQSLINKVYFQQNHDN